MAELKIFYRDKDKQDRIKVGRSVNILNSLDKKDIIWIDLLDVSDKTEGVLEDFLKIDIQEDEVGVSHDRIVGLYITRRHLDLFHLFILLDVDFEEVL